MGTVDENFPAACGKNPLTEEFGTFVKETLEKWKVPGISLAVIDGEDVYAEVAGPNDFTASINWLYSKY
jgi:hypothetical protein